MAFGSMLRLLERGLRPHRFYLLAVFVAKGLVDLDCSGPADGGRQAVQRGLLDFGLIATGSAGGVDCSHPMNISAHGLRLALTGAVALALFSGCGGCGEEEPASSPQKAVVPTPAPTPARDVHPTD